MYICIYIYIQKASIPFIAADGAMAKKKTDRLIYQATRV